MKNTKHNYAFVDNENVNVSVQKQNRKIDRGKFRERLREEWNVEVAYMFMGYLEEYEAMYTFFKSLGYELIFRPMNPNPDIPYKGNIDTELVLQAMIDRPRYQQAVIVSGDGDFASLVRHLKSKKKLATVIVPNERRYSSFLHEAAGDQLLSLNSLKHKLRYKASSKKGGVAVTKKKLDQSYTKSAATPTTAKSTSVADGLNERRSQTTSRPSGATKPTKYTNKTSGVTKGQHLPGRGSKPQQARSPSVRSHAQNHRPKPTKTKPRREEGHDDRFYA